MQRLTDAMLESSVMALVCSGCSQHGPCFNQRMVFHEAQYSYDGRCRHDDCSLRFSRAGARRGNRTVQGRNLFNRSLETGGLPRPQGSRHLVRGGLSCRQVTAFEDCSHAGAGASAFTGARCDPGRHRLCGGYRTLQGRNLYDRRLQSGSLPRPQGSCHLVCRGLRIG